ncbi:MAG: TonB-dependent receptor [Thermoanaerobaculales bacterium]|jgi:iron complex outermembrane receptor protein|nr:TonB-dependent receptor [Thermoanaerobaculales bacterium]
MKPASMTIASIAAVAVLVGAASASGAELRGRLSDRRTGDAIAGASVEVTLGESSITATTGADGGFTIPLPDPPPPSARLVVTATGYEVLNLVVTDLPHTPPLNLEAVPVVFRGEVSVTGLGATIGETPVTVTEVGRPEIERGYWAQDIPIFLEQTPGFLATNDSGNGIGYSYFYLRGFDMRRTAVSLNGVPLNDAHSHSVFFIDHADLLSTTGTIQVQRGVGTSLYGGSAIGGSVNIESRRPLAEPRLRLAALGGSFGTGRLTLEYDSGLFDDRWAATARYSRVSSDGYRDQSWAEMWSYSLSVVRYGERTTLQVNLFGGPEETHLAYVGVPRANLEGEITGDRRVDRRANPLSYPGEIDSFFQPHYQLVHDWQVGADLALRNTLFLFEGDGYFQQLAEDAWMPEYGLNPVELPDGTVVDTTDLVTRREVEEWDAGWIPNLEWRHADGRGALQAGLALRLHSGRHWGEVQWARLYPPDLPPDHRYYDYRLDKQTVQPFLQESWSVADRWHIMAGLTWTHHRYEMHDDRVAGVEVEESFSYLLPRLGVTYRPTERLSLFANVSRGGREPAFRDIYDPQSIWSPPPLDLEPEELTDYELGLSYGWSTGRVAANLYYLDFDNAIVWAGGLDNNGDPVTANGAVTEHRGAELEVEWNPTPRFGGRLDLAWARSRFVEFVEHDFDGNAVDQSGNSLPVSPEWLVSVEAHGSVGPVLGSLTLRHVDDFYLDNTEDMRDFPEVRDDPSYIHRVNDAFTAVDLAVEVDLGRSTAEVVRARSLRIQLRVNNLTDELFTTFGYFDGSQPVWIPAATRSAYAGLVVDW